MLNLLVHQATTGGKKTTDTKSACLKHPVYWFVHYNWRNCVAFHTKMAKSELESRYKMQMNQDYRKNLILDPPPKKKKIASRCCRTFFFVVVAVFLNKLKKITLTLTLTHFSPQCVIISSVLSDDDCWRYSGLKLTSTHWLSWDVHY